MRGLLTAYVALDLLGGGASSAAGRVAARLRPGKTTAKTTTTGKTV